MRAFFVIAVFITLTTGCRAPGGQLTQTYRLDEGLILNSDIHEVLVVGLGPIYLPETLDRPQLVRRDKQNRLLIHHEHRWKDSLGQSVKRSLAENLRQLHPDWKIVFHPWYRRSGVQVQVTIDVERFDALVDRRVILAGKINVVDPVDEGYVHRYDFLWEERMSSSEMSDQVAVMRQMVSALSHRLSVLVHKHLAPAKLPHGISIGEHTPDP